MNSQDLEILWAVFAFFVGKTTPYGKIFKILFRKFLPLHRSTLLCSNVIKFVRREIGEIVCYLPDQKENTKNSAVSQIVATALLATKICNSQPSTMWSQCSRFRPNRFTFGGVIAERMNTIFCLVEYFCTSPKAMLHFGRMVIFVMDVCCSEYIIVWTYEYSIGWPLLLIHRTLYYVCVDGSACMMTSVKVCDGCFVCIAYNET